MSELDRRNISDQNQLSLLQASKPKEGIPIIDNSDSLKKYIKATIYEEKSLFLKECVKLNILLPSNNIKGIDFDLLLVQQERRISKQLQDTGTFKLQIQLKPHEKQDISKIKWHYRRKYIDKINWLWFKQAENRRSLPTNFTINRNKTRRNRRSRLRYRKRRKEKNKALNLAQVNSIVLNKSSIDLSNDVKELLAKGLNFVPTPKWNENICDQEWCFLTEHTRRVEWADIFKNNENMQNEECLPTKLIIPKFSRPPTESLTEEVATYKKLVETKLGNLGPKVEKQYLHNNNLPFRLKQALKTIKMLISEQKVVVCRTDKDGKILIVNYSDYHEIMEKELNKFDVLQFTPQIMHKQFEVNKRKCENLIISLFEKGVISKDLLYHSTGHRVKENCYQKVTGELAKYFACSSPAYAYPLFKTHKLQPDHLFECSNY